MTDSNLCFDIASLKEKFFAYYNNDEKRESWYRDWVSDLISETRRAPEEWNPWEYVMSVLLKEGNFKIEGDKLCLNWKNLEIKEIFEEAIENLLSGSPAKQIHPVSIAFNDETQAYEDLAAVYFSCALDETVKIDTSAEDHGYSFGFPLHQLELSYTHHMLLKSSVNPNEFHEKLSSVFGDKLEEFLSSQKSREEYRLKIQTQIDDLVSENMKLKDENIALKACINAMQKILSITMKRWMSKNNRII